MNLLEKDDYAQHLAEASIDEIVDIHFFILQALSNIATMTEQLVSSCVSKWSFPVLRKVFPDDPRDVNDYFYMHALHFLIELEKVDVDINWLPSWLTSNWSSPSALHVSIKRLIHLCLTYFDQDEPRKAILLASNTYRRIFKLLAMTLPHQKKAAEIEHILTRYFAAELSW